MLISRFVARQTKGRRSALAQITVRAALERFGEERDLQRGRGERHP
jgi:hypothetical protein